MKAILILAALLAADGISFVAGATVGPTSWHAYCFPYACPKPEVSSIVIQWNSEAMVTIKPDGQVYFGRRYNRAREAQLLADAAKLLIQDQPWPTCELAYYHSPPHGMIGELFGTADPLPPRKEETP